MQHAVDTVTDDSVLGFGLDMDVAGAVADRLGNDGVDDADDGRHLGRTDQFLDAGLLFFLVENYVDLVQRFQILEILFSGTFGQTPGLGYLLDYL